MRRLTCLAAALVLIAAGVARADEQADLRQLLNKAVKAMGGADDLARYRAATIKAKGTWYGLDANGVPYTGEMFVTHPDKMRLRFESEVSGINFTYVRVINGDKVWVQAGGPTTQATDKDVIAEAQEANYVADVVTLLPLLADKEFTLTALPETKVNGRPALGMRVAHKGHRDVTLYFDKETAFLLKCQCVVKDMLSDGKEVTQETFYDDYKEVNGLKHAWKIVVRRNNKKFLDSQITGLEVKEKLDDSLFARP
jgi:hypothetical protein